MRMRLFLTYRWTWLLLMLACVITTDALAAQDLLSGTDANLLATINGSGKKYIYLAEGFLSLATYIKTKNLMVLFGIVIVAFFFNVILKVAGA